MKPSSIIPLVTLLASLEMVGCLHPPATPNIRRIDVPPDTVAKSLKTAATFRPITQLDSTTPMSVLLDETGPYLRQSELDTSTAYRVFWFYGRANRVYHVQVLSFLEGGSPHAVVFPLIRVASESMYEIQVEPKEAVLVRTKADQEALLFVVRFSLPWNSFYNVFLSPDPRARAQTLHTPITYWEEGLIGRRGERPVMKDVGIRDIRLIPSSRGLLELELVAP